MYACDLLYYVAIDSNCLYLDRHIDMSVWGARADVAAGAAVYEMNMPGLHVQNSYILPIFRFCKMKMKIQIVCMKTWVYPHQFGKCCSMYYTVCETHGRCLSSRIRYLLTQ